MNKTVYRILGILASAMIIASVFIPFVSTQDVSISLWGQNIKSLYLPVMIIVFAVIGIVLFLLNKNTEFVYMSTGAILFFIIIETVKQINESNNIFKTLDVGYYFLVIGTILGWVMTFLLNLRSRKVEKSDIKVETPNQTASNNVYDNSNQLSNMLSQNNITNNSNSIRPEAANPIFPMEDGKQQLINPVLTEFNMGGSQPSTLVAPIPDVSVPQAPIEPSTPVAPIPDVSVPQAPIEPSASVTPIPDVSVPQASIEPSAPVAPIPDVSVPQAPIEPSTPVAPIPDASVPQAPIEPSTPVAPIPDASVPQASIEPSTPVAPIPDMDGQNSVFLEPIKEPKSDNPFVYNQPTFGAINNNQSTETNNVDIFGQTIE